MAVVDASVLVALCDADDVDHAKARSVLTNETRIAATGGTLVELSRILRRRANLQGRDGNATARIALQTLRGLPGFRDTGDGLARQVAERYAAEPQLSYADAWGIEAALADRDGLLTFDKLQQAAWRRAKRS